MRCSWASRYPHIRRVSVSWQKNGAPDVLCAVGVIDLQLRGVRAVHKVLAVVGPVGRQALVGVRHLLHMRQQSSSGHAPAAFTPS